MFSSHASLKSLMYVCRSLSTMLEAGVDIKRAFEIAGTKSSDPTMKQQLSEASTAIRSGADVTEALSQSPGYFPQLMIDMIKIGEQTGTVPEVLRGLADHFENQLRLRRDFWSAITWPLIQFVLAVLVIAGLLIVLEWVASIRGGEPLDVLGIGLTGTTGAIIWLTLVFGSIFAGYVGYQVVRRSLRGKRSLDSTLMKIPVVGKCMQSFAVARFSWAFALTQQSGMTIKPSLEASLTATSNGAYIGTIDQVWHDVKNGDTLGTALARINLFPEDFIEMVHVAENSGTVPEALQRLSPQFEDQARRSLRALAGALGWVVWVTVAIFIIIFIFRIAGMYIGLIDDAARGI